MRKGGRRRRRENKSSEGRREEEEEKGREKREGKETVVRDDQDQGHPPTLSNSCLPHSFSIQGPQ